MPKGGQSHFFAHALSKLCILLTTIVLLAAAPDLARALPSELAAKTSGTVFPHILKTQTYELNARNIKVLKAHGKTLWMGTSMGVVAYDTTTAGDYQIFDNRNALLSNGIFHISFDRQGEPWVGTYGGGLSRRRAGQWVNYNTPQGLCDSFVYDLEFAGDDLWIATWSGANRVAGDPRLRASWKAFTTENTGGGLIDNWVYAIEIGKDGRVWFGTESGISMFDGKTWLKWNHTAGLGAPLDAVQRENLDAMPSFEGAHHASQPPDLPNTGKSDYRPNYVVSMLLDEDRGLWIGTWGGGLSLFDTRKRVFRNFTAQDGLPGNFIFALKKDPYGNLWIGSNRGLSRFDGKTFTNYAKLNGLAGDFVFSIEFGEDHSLWAGSHGGMTRLLMDPVSRELLKSD